MLRSLRERFESYLQVATTPGDPVRAEDGLHLACAVLLLEMAHADHDFHPEEDAEMQAALCSALELRAEQVSELMQAAHEEVGQAVSLHDYTSLINRQCEPAQKYHLIELLWQVAHADGKIDRYEEHFVRKIADLIYVRHAQFIRAKLQAEARYRESRSDV